MEGFLAGLFFAAIVAAFIPHPSLQQVEIEWGEKVCAANGGLDSLRPSGRLILPTRATCKNSAVFIRNASEQQAT